MAVSLGGVAVASACGFGVGRSSSAISSLCRTTTTTAAAGRTSHHIFNRAGYRTLSGRQQLISRYQQKLCSSTTTTTAGGDDTTTVPPTTVPVTTSTTVKPTTTTTAAIPAGGNCTKPVFTSSDPEATTGALDSNGTWWVNNDAWAGSHGPQSISVCSQSSWYAVSDQEDVDGQVETYPDTEYDIGGRDNGTTKTIAQYNSITSTFSEAFPSAGSWDAAYDLWLNNWGTEIMIWNEWTGTQLYWPGPDAKAVTLDGVAYHFVNNDGEFIFTRDNMVKSGSVNILAAMQYLVSQGLVKSTDMPTQLEYGVEVCSTNGPETFPMTGLTFNLS